MDYRGVITIEAGKRGGKPCIQGLRVTVSDVLDDLASGMSEDEILQDFPDLTRDDIRACLAFAADRERRLLVPGAACSCLLDQNLSPGLCEPLRDADDRVGRTRRNRTRHL